jgi:hypothetical protein
VVSYHSSYHSLGCWLCPYAVSCFSAVVNLAYLYIFSPRSMEGGDLRWFWSNFEMFERIDHVSIFFYAIYRNLLWSRYTASKDTMIRQVLRLPLVRFDCTLYIPPFNISFTAISNLIETSLNVGLHSHVFYCLTF